ncbi:phospholipase D-like domain-containing protein [Pseudomonas sp.]|uniref:phospholipase D-like domain-containing protein n=1 Tax=Pseudomonas sp. TaxID=306 RepID=UPI00272A84A9|nr:phospholipase D-like domain-containing protein [Pseudomonas sp.]
MDPLRRINRPPASARPGRLLVLLVLLAWLGSALFERYKPVPEGLSHAAPMRPASELRILLDQTYANRQGERVIRQRIFDEVFALIDQARRLIVVDMFLFNEFANDSAHRALTAELTTALVAARQRQPAPEVWLVTDPFNTLYGGIAAPHLEQLESAGVNVVLTDVSQLRASNPLWSGFWRLCCSQLGNSTEGWLPNPVAEPPVTLRTYLHLANFRANHRKTLVVDQGDDWIGLITSANPQDASSSHSNSALRFRGAAALDLLQTERAVLGMNGILESLDEPLDWPPPPASTTAEGAPLGLQVLTEGAITRALLAMVDSAGAGDRLDVEVFYLSHRPLIEALIAAHERGTRVRVLLDPNRDAFGREKNGIPNRQAAWDLHRAGIELRWCYTQGEQCHRKWALLDRADGSSELIGGSSNFTRRNLDDLNLETNLRVVTHLEHPSLGPYREHFERAWSNAGGELHSLPYEDFADHSRFNYALYRVMEATGLSTF